MSRNPKEVFLCQLSFSAHDDFLSILESIIEIDVDRDSDSIPDRSTSIHQRQWNAGRSRGLHLLKEPQVGPFGYSSSKNRDKIFYIADINRRHANNSSGENQRMVSSRLRHLPVRGIAGNDSIAYS